MGDDGGVESLDALANLDEPELLMGALKRVAERRPGKSWRIIKEAASLAEEALRKENEAPSRPRGYVEEGSGGRAADEGKPRGD